MSNTMLRRPHDEDNAGLRSRNARLAADVQRLRAELADERDAHAVMAEALRYSLRELGGLAHDQPGLRIVLDGYDERKKGEQGDG